MEDFVPVLISNLRVVIHNIAIVHQIVLIGLTATLVYNLGYFSV